MLGAVAAAGLASCGGGEASEPAPATVEEYTTTQAPRGRAITDWQQASSEVCTEYIPLIERTLDGLGDQPTPDEMAVVFGRVIDLELRFLDALLAIPEPAERTRAVKRVNEKLQRAREQVQVALESVARNDYGAFLSARSVLTNYTDTDGDYEALDVPECVAED